MVLRPDTGNNRLGDVREFRGYCATGDDGAMKAIHQPHSCHASRATCSSQKAISPPSKGSHCTGRSENWNVSEFSW
jgi:hypothetical protein